MGMEILAVIVHLAVGNGTPFVDQMELLIPTHAVSAMKAVAKTKPYLSLIKDFAVRINFYRIKQII